MFSDSCCNPLNQNTDMENYKLNLKRVVVSLPLADLGYRCIFLMSVKSDVTSSLCSIFLVLSVTLVNEKESNLSS